MSELVHIFVGKFASGDDACLHTEAQWEPEPFDSVSDVEYAAWEDRNPTWPLCDEQGDDAYLDSDFIETIDGDDRFAYLATYLTNDSDVDRVRSLDPNANVLVLVFPDAFGGFDLALRSTSRMTYVGAFDFSWP